MSSEPLFLGPKSHSGVSQGYYLSSSELGLAGGLLVVCFRVSSVSLQRSGITELDTRARTESIVQSD